VVLMVEKFMESSMLIAALLFDGLRIQAIKVCGSQ